jgi:nucleoside-diphosphate-sugar epimerase
MNNLKILITGGAGFVPGSLAAKLAQDKSNFIVVVDNFLTGKKRNIPKGDNVRFIKCDVNDYLEIAPIMTSHQFDYVFHYAAVVGVKRTLANPAMVLEDLAGIKNILGLCKNTGVKRVFYSSSSEVYGEPVELPQHEETTPLRSILQSIQARIRFGLYDFSVFQHLWPSSKYRFCNVKIHKSCTKK